MAKRTRKKPAVSRDGIEDPAQSDLTAPQNPDELAAFVRTHMNAQVAVEPLMEGNDGPLAYLVHSFFEGRFVPAPGGGWHDHGKSGDGRPPTDSVVWANRGGGKTFLGAVATALDLIFKPGIEVRILGGSAEQGRRMHEHLRKVFENEALEHLLDGRTTDNRVRLKNRSRVEILSHSERSVRGVRVQKLRCDEVDLFDKDLWEAAQLVTRSTSPIPGPWGDEVKGSIEVLSTMHVPMGMMWSVVKDSARIGEWRTPGAENSSAQRGVCAKGEHHPYALAQGIEPQGTQSKPSRVLFKWGVIDALEKCGPRHACVTCPLHVECGGRAKQREIGGHMTIADALVLKRRSSRSTWESEMLCREPSREGCVYPEFSRATHVVSPGPTMEDVLRAGGTVVAGMDFGVRAPSVVVWGHLEPNGVLTIVDEYAETGRTLGEHVAVIKSRAWGGGPPAWIGIDPAGTARNEQTGQSNFRAMRNMHMQIKARRTHIAPGIDAVRAMISPALGKARIRVSARCPGLIDALCRYHYPPDKPSDLTPVKNGSDHWCDALRYLVVNLDHKGVGIGHT